MGETMLVPRPRQPHAIESVRVEADPRLERMQAVLDALRDYE